MSFGFKGEARATSDILQSCFALKALVLAKHLYSAIFECVDEHHFLRNWGHSDLRSQKYAEVAENSLGLIRKCLTDVWNNPCLPLEPKRHSSLSNVLSRQKDKY